LEGWWSAESFLFPLADKINKLILLHGTTRTRRNLALPRAFGGSITTTDYEKRQTERSDYFHGWG
jgi:hypothetical protein